MEAKETEDKGKLIAYKLFYWYWSNKNVNAKLEEFVLNANVEFIFKDFLGIIKKEFYDFIIDNIKKKR